jgi:signal transduction histidine kinase
MVFHKPKAAIILVNKIYRDEFSENDLAFSLIASQKITYHMEDIFLKNSSAPEQLFSGEDKKILKELKLFKQIMDSVHFGAVVFNRSFRIKYINMSALSVLNYSRSNQSPQYVKDLFSKDEFDRIKGEFNKRDFPLIRKELHLESAKVPHYFIGYSIYDLTGSDEKEQYIIIFSEISQTKRIQAEIIRMDRMASLGALSSGIAHEIRNPLAGIKAMAQTLEDELDETSIQSEYVERIIRQVNRLDILLKSFFTYASPARPDPSAFHIKKIVNEIVPLISRKIRDRKIKIKEKYDKDLAQVFVDANQIEQVFLNLFLNAIDAMKDGGTISITASNAQNPPAVMDRRNPGPGLLSNYFIEIKIADTGEGIPENLCDRIFTPFYTTKSNGTGLGLSIVYQIIKEHGGRIDAESTVGEGTEFTIVLPALQKSRE